MFAGYLSQSMRLGVLTMPQHQVFSLEQLEEATGNFSRGALIGEGIRGKVRLNAVNLFVRNLTRCECLVL